MRYFAKLSRTDFRVDRNFVIGILKSDWLILLLILGLAYYIAFIPHSNYPYPVHIDEWTHLAQQNAILDAGSVTYTEPFYGQLTVTIATYFENGYDLFWAVFHQISGIPWMAIYRYFPGIILIFSVICVYVLGKRQGFGWEAALFAALIPTTVGILGTAFLVPISMGSIFIVLGLFLAIHFRGIWCYATIFLFTCTLFLMHAATALGFATILAPIIIINLRKEFRHSLGVGLAIGIPCIVPLLFFPNELIERIEVIMVPQYLNQFVDYPVLIQTFGYLPILLCLGGVAALVVNGDRKSYGTVLSLVAILLMMVTFFSLHYGIPIMYARGLIWLMLLMSIIAGAGLSRIKSFSLPLKLSGKVFTWLTANTGKLVCAALITVTLVTVIPQRLQADYYFMIDKHDYLAFTWIRENLDQEYDKGILDPWKATAFTSISGRTVYARTHSFPDIYDKEASTFIEDGATDTAFLIKHNISIVYSRKEVNNPDLVEVREDIYVLKEGILTE